MIKQKRERCRHCEFLAVQCVCKWIPKVKTQLEILILQDPKEAEHPKNTVSLLRLGLTTVRCVSTHDRNLLQATLSQLDTARWKLVFPNDHAIAVESIGREEKAEVEGIILIDATWRKAKKLFLTEPLLQRFHSMTFCKPPSGKYTIRKSPSDLSISTLEACAYVVEQIEGENMQPLRQFMIDAQEWQWRKQPLHHRHIES